ncbi:MAG TPA: carboxypeptidase-like regulatory domain-containing protein [Kofleriaceae bacterium]
MAAAAATRAPPRAAILAAATGSGAIDGIVVDERNVPVSGAAVLVTSHDEVRSETDGSFHVAGVAPGRYYLNAHSETGAAGPLPLEVDEAPLSVVVRLHPGVSLAVEVVSIVDGHPVPNARGSLLFSSMIGAAGHVETVAGADGILHFPVAALGNYHILAEADGFAPATRLLTWNDRAGLMWRALIALEPGVVLTGRVVDESGVPVRGARVTSRPPPRAQTQMAYRPRPPDPLRPPVMTDSDGRFRYPVPVGQGLVLLASHEHYAGGDSGPLVATGPADIVIRLRAGQRLTGRVVDRDHRPVAQATVTDGAPESAPAHIARTDADGRFVMEGIDRRRHDAILFAEAHGMRASPVLVSLPSGFDRPIELVVEHDLRAAGIVVDSSGVPVGDAIVHFQHVVAPSYRPPPANPTAVLEPMVTGETRADASGAFVISGLGPGDVQLLARAPSAGGDRASPPLTATTSAKAGDEKVVITLPAPARIRGRVVTASGRPPTGMEVSLLQFGGPLPVADPEGRFELSQIDPAPGTYSVKVTADGSAARTVEARVTAGQTTDLGIITLEAGRTLRGRVLDAGGSGPVANALVSVDGPKGTRIASCRTDELGGFEVPVPNDPVMVHATVPGVGGSRFELVAPTRNSVELRLPETGRIEVTVTGPAAAGALTVSATRTDAVDGGFRIFMLNRDPGQPTFQADVSAGEYVVHASPGTGVAAMKGGDTQHDVAVAVAVGQIQKVTIATGGSGTSPAQDGANR